MRLLGFFVRMLAIAALVVSVSGPVVQAGSTTFDLSTNFTLVNLDDTVDAYGDPVTNTGVITFLTETAPGVFEQTEASLSLTGLGDQAIYRQYWSGGINPDLPEGPGAAIVASEGPVASVVQVMAVGVNPTQRAAYSGFSESSTKYYVPLVQRGNSTLTGVANSQIVIQNTSGMTVTASVDLFQDGLGLTYTKDTDPIAPGTAFTYDLADESTSLIPMGWVGSAVIEASDSIAVVSNLFTGTSFQAFNGFAADSGNVEWFVPAFASKLATLDGPLSTPLRIQNVGDATIPIGGIEVTFTPNPAYPGSTLVWTNPMEIPVGESFNINPANSAAYPSGLYGACRIVATSNVVAFVQMRAIGTSLAAAFEAFSQADGSLNVMVPLVAKRLANGFCSSVAIQNISDTAATVDLIYTPSTEYSGSQLPIEVLDQVILPYENLNHNHRSAATVPAMPEGWVGSLTILSDQPVVSFVQLTSLDKALAGDTMQAHNAIPF